jgi:hypothetical protein
MATPQDVAARRIEADQANPAEPFRVSATTPHGVSALTGGELVWPQFGDAEQLLLDEARRRHDFEQKSASALHAKSALAVTLTGILAAFITSSSTSALLSDKHRQLPVRAAAACVLALSLVALVASALLLVRSAVSRAYQIPAPPARWILHLGRLRQLHVADEQPDRRVLSHLQYDLLDAWAEAAQACAEANDAKARSFSLALALLSVAVPAAVLTLAGLLIQGIVQ